MPQKTRITEEDLNYAEKIRRSLLAEGKKGAYQIRRSLLDEKNDISERDLSEKRNPKQLMRDLKSIRHRSLSSFNDPKKFILGGPQSGQPRGALGGPQSGQPQKTISEGGQEKKKNSKQLNRDLGSARRASLRANTEQVDLRSRAQKYSDQFKQTQGKAISKQGLVPGLSKRKTWAPDAAEMEKILSSPEGSRAANRALKKSIHKKRKTIGSARSEAVQRGGMGGFIVALIIALIKDIVDALLLASTIGAVGTFFITLPFTLLLLTVLRYGMLHYMFKQYNLKFRLKAHIRKKIWLYLVSYIVEYIPILGSIYPGTTILIILLKRDTDKAFKASQAQLSKMRREEQQGEAEWI